MPSGSILMYLNEIRVSRQGRVCCAGRVSIYPIFARCSWGPSQTTLTKFCPLLTTYVLHTYLVTLVNEFPYCFKRKSTYRWQFQYYLPTSSCQRSLWTTPKTTATSVVVMNPRRIELNQGKMTWQKINLSTLQYI